MAAIDIARYVITVSLDDGYPVSNLKLQKMLYFIQGVMLVKYKKKAFDEDLVAWQYGPVVKSVYFEFSSYGAMPILLKYKDIQINDEQRSAADTVINSFLKVSAFTMVDETHREGSPWYTAYHSENNVINLEELRKYFISEYTK